MLYLQQQQQLQPGADYLLVNYVFTAQVIYSSESYQEKRVSEYYNSVKNICRDTYQTV